MNKATYLSLKSDLQREFGVFLEEASACTRIWPWLEAFACLGSSRERKVQVPKSSERFCCVKICRDASSKRKPF
ncbi:hypothetical protein HKD37_09G025032 [Glycine soja]